MLTHMYTHVINDMDNVISDCSISLYANDTSLYYASRSFVDLLLAFRGDISFVGHWLNENRLILNTKNKTKQWNI